MELILPILTANGSGDNFLKFILHALLIGKTKCVGEGFPTQMPPRKRREEVGHGAGELFGGGLPGPSRGAASSIVSDPVPTKGQGEHGDKRFRSQTVGSGDSRQAS